MVRILRAVVPFAECAGSVARSLEDFGNGLFIEIEPLTASGDAVDTAARMITPGEKLGARWRANRANVEVLEDRASASERINTRGREVRVAVDAQIAPTLVVSEDNNYIWLGRRG